MLNTMLNAYHPANNTPNRAVFFRSLDISRDNDPSPPPAAAFVVRVAPRRPLEPKAASRRVFCSIIIRRLAKADVFGIIAKGSLDGTTDDCATHSNVLLLLLDPTQTPVVGVLDADDKDDLKKVVFFGCRTEEETKRDVVVVIDANADALVFIVLRKTSVEKRGEKCR